MHVCDDQEDWGGAAGGPQVHELAAETIKGASDVGDNAEGVRGEEAEVQGCQEPKEEASESHRKGDIQRIRGKEVAAWLHLRARAFSERTSQETQGTEAAAGASGLNTGHAQVWVSAQNQIDLDSEVASKQN